MVKKQLENERVRITSTSDIEVRVGQKLASWSIAGVLERSDRAEASFVGIALDRNYVVWRSSLTEDRQQHWDYIIWRDLEYGLKEPMKVDVKAIRKFQWLGNFLQEDYVCIEFRNTKGNNGWYEGMADWIAFERFNDFVMVPLPAIKQIMNDIFRPDAGYHKDWEADKNKLNYVSKPYTFTSREGKRDLFYWIETHKLFSYDYSILRKI